MARRAASQPIGKVYGSNADASARADAPTDSRGSRAFGFVLAWAGTQQADSSALVLLSQIPIQGVFEEALTGHRYEGDWVRGVRDGEGEFVSGDGAFRYSGTGKKGRRAGRGRAEIHGSTYEGEWKNDAFHGTGVLVDTAGNQYEGEFQQGRKHGSGTQTYADGSKYSGEWRDGARHGTGHLVARDGSTYSGQWRDGVPSGEGTRVAATGATHRGVFADGKPHGWGVATDDGASAASASAGTSGELPPLYGGALVDSAHGYAAFSDVTIGGALRRLRFRARSPGLADALSEPFDVVLAGEPVTLKLSGAPLPGTVVVTAVADGIAGMQTNCPA